MMRTTFVVRTTGTLATLTAMVVASAVAQDSCSADQRIGVLDITGLACESCSFSRSDQGYTSARFRTEPTIMSVSPHGASAGLLHEGDVLVAIDGDLITTREGSRRFTNLPSSGSVTVRIRRGGSTRDVDVPVRSVCRDEPLRTVLGRRNGITQGVSVLDSVLSSGVPRPLPRAGQSIGSGSYQGRLGSARADSVRGRNFALPLVSDSVPPLGRLTEARARGLTTSIYSDSVRSVVVPPRADRVDSVTTLPRVPGQIGRTVIEQPSSAVTVSPRAPRASQVGPERPALPSAPRWSPSASETMRPRARLGFGLQCSDCTIDLSAEDEGARWTFGNQPVVYGVEAGSPAFAAGLREGDVLEALDGLDLTSEEGGRRLGGIRPGDALVWTVRRGDRTLRIGTVAEERARTPSPVALEPLRYSGGLGGTTVEVHGAPVSVTEDLSTGEIVIRSDDLLVRVRTRR